MLLLLSLPSQYKSASQTIYIGKPVVKNQCSSLGQNNPLKAKDCSIFNSKKLNCCLLSATTSEVVTLDDGTSIEEKMSKTACIIMPAKYSTEELRTTRRGYMAELGIDDILIECGGFMTKCKYFVMMALALLVF